MSSIEARVDCDVRPRGAGRRGSSASFNAPAVPHQLKHPFWRGAQAGEKLMGRLKGLTAVATALPELHHSKERCFPILYKACRHHRKVPVDRCVNIY